MEYEAFVYKWTDNLKNKYYIGFHKGKIDDGYICSSKDMLKEYRQRELDFTREVLFTGTTDNMLALETKLLVENDAANSEVYYNKHNANGKWICRGHSDKTKELIGKKQLGRKRTQETKDKIRNALKGKPISDEARKKMSISAKKRANTEEGKARLRKISYLGPTARVNSGYIISEDTKQKISKTVKSLWKNGHYKNKKLITTINEI